ncbi:MAG: hypothetical protein U5K69_25000 [Balneolaceae bacterium]|nr:hypothetical protein [Balneolaceae bacterium]
MAYIKQDPEVRRKFESIKRIKEIVSTRCPCRNAPNHLKQKVRSYIRTQGVDGAGFSDQQEPFYDIPCNQNMSSAGQENPPASKRNYQWIYAAAASLLVIALVFGIYDYVQAPDKSYNVEEYAYAHFMKHQGKLVQPTIETASPANAELELASAFNMPITIPPLKNAEFKGAVMSDFIPGYQTPMLEYYLPSEDQYVYIFAFKISQLSNNSALYRSKDAVESCVKAKDFHIRNINGKHVVSWKWDDTWYAAISNHNGETLASLVEPLAVNQ